MIDRLCHEAGNDKQRKARMHELLRTQACHCAQWPLEHTALAKAVCAHAAHEERVLSLQTMT
jgi:hypothetical protein